MDLGCGLLHPQCLLSAVAELLVFVELNIDTCIIILLYYFFILFFCIVILLECMYRHSWGVLQGHVLCWPSGGG